MDCLGSNYELSHTLPRQCLVSDSEVLSYEISYVVPRQCLGSEKEFSYALPRQYPASSIYYFSTELSCQAG